MLRSIISPWIPFAGDLEPIIAGIEDFNPLAFLIAILVAKGYQSHSDRVSRLLLRSVGRLALTTVEPPDQARQVGTQRTAQRIDKKKSVTSEGGVSLFDKGDGLSWAAVSSLLTLTFAAGSRIDHVRQSIILKLKDVGARVFTRSTADAKLDINFGY